MRVCDFCECSLVGRRRHAFVTRSGRLSCGRGSTQRTVDGALKTVTLPCAKAVSS